MPFALDCLAIVAAQSENHLLAARLFGAADGARKHMGFVRFKIFDEGDDATIASLRDALGTNDFDDSWAEGSALSIQEAIAYALRGRGERKRASSGWASLTRAELDVVKLVSAGLGNKEVSRAAVRLTADRPSTPHSRLQQTWVDFACSARARGGQVHLNLRGRSVRSRNPTESRSVRRLEAARCAS